MERIKVCVYPDCEKTIQEDVWCSRHYGFFPHQCEADGCSVNIIFDDEPLCFIHSPWQGSSGKGYSAYKKAMGLA
jgi:hypothetical protein